MTTIRQIAANRRNAKRSTGPLTPAGKTRVSQNAVRHGFTARAFVLKDEDLEAYGALRESVLEELEPRSNVECFLAERIAEGMWRLNRCMAIEAGLLDSERLGFSSTGSDLSDAFRASAKAIGQLCEYENGIDRRLHLALRTLALVRLARAAPGRPVSARPSLPEIAAPEAPPEAKLMSGEPSAP